MQKPEQLFRRYIQVPVQRLKQKRLIQKYRGTGVYCVICTSEFRSFAPFGKDHRPNARCPQCGSLERHRLIYRYLQQESDLFDARYKTLLHFAPEVMFQDAFRTHSSLQYMPCDLSPAKYGADVIKVDITRIPLDEASVDVVLCNHVLEHVPDDRKAMAELFRVLKRGGWGVVLVPVDLNREKTYEDPAITTPADRLRAYGRKDHVRWYGRDYGDRLREAGFEVREWDPAAEMGEAERHRYGFRMGEWFTVIRKP